MWWCCFIYKFHFQTSFWPRASQAVLERAFFSFLLLAIWHSYHFIMSYLIMSFLVMSFHVMSFLVMSCHFFSCHFLSCHFLTCHFISCHFLLCHIIWCQFFCCAICTYYLRYVLAFPDCYNSSWSGNVYSHTRKYPPGKQKFGGFWQISLRLFELQKSLIPHLKALISSSYEPKR